jgi:hypothetical protein
MRAYKVICLLVALLILANGCASISKSEAEAITGDFVNKNVKFYTKTGESSLDLPGHSIDSITSYKEGNNWVVIAHVSAQVGEEVKDNDLVLKINSKGEVIEFNGKEIPK